MTIEFDNEDIKLFFTTGNGRGSFYRKLRSNHSFMTSLKQVIAILRSVENVSGLSNYGALHYEKLKHELGGYSSVRIGYKSKYRLIFSEHDNGIKIIVIQISEHYGDI